MMFFACRGDHRSSAYKKTDSRGRLSLQFRYGYNKIGGVSINDMETPPIIFLLFIFRKLFCLLFSRKK